MKKGSVISIALFIFAAWIFLVFQVAGPLLPRTDICKRKALTSIPIQNENGDLPLSQRPFDSVPVPVCQGAQNVPVEQRLLNGLWDLFEFKTPKQDTSYYSFIIKEYLGNPKTPPPDTLS